MCQTLVIKPNYQNNKNYSKHILKDSNIDDIYEKYSQFQNMFGTTETNRFLTQV